MKRGFWQDEPVGVGSGNAPISPAKRAAPENLPRGYAFATLENVEIAQLHALIKSSYGEDGAVLGYAEDFLRWEMENPQHRREYALALKFEAALVGFVMAKEQRVVVRSAEVALVGVNFLCLHATHRGTGLAPLLIREITRRANENGIATAIFTGGRELAFSFCRAQYVHRPVNAAKLAELGFVPKWATRFATACEKKLRPMADADVDALLRAYERECACYDVYEKMDRCTFAHTFLPRSNFVFTYVAVDNACEFVSFFVVDTVFADKKTIKTAYLHYYASEDPQMLVDALVPVLAGLEIDLLNFLAVGKNTKITGPAYFPGTGFLNYSFYNFRTEKVAPERLFFIMH